MKRILALALCATALAATAGPFDQVKGKVKPGLYEYKMQMDIPGMPAGMKPPPMTVQHCVTQKDIDEGGFAKGKDPNQQNCEVKDFKTSGNTASYTMECKGQQQMRADVKMNFVDNGFNSEMKMSMNQGGQVMNMNQKMESRLLGPCK